MSGQASDINEVASCLDFALHEDCKDRDALAHTLAATGTRSCIEQATAPTTRPPALAAPEDSASTCSLRRS
jgi:hypothetical protein